MCTPSSALGFKFTFHFWTISQLQIKKKNSLKFFSTFVFVKAVSLILCIFNFLIIFSYLTSFFFGLPSGTCLFISQCDLHFWCHFIFSPIFLSSNEVTFSCLSSSCHARFHLLCTSGCVCLCVCVCVSSYVRERKTERERERMQVLWFNFLYSQIFLISKVIALLITQTLLQCASPLDKPFGDGASVNSFIYPRTYKL